MSRAGRRQPLVMDSLDRMDQPAIQVGRLGAVEVHPRDGRVIGEESYKVVGHQVFRVDRRVRTADPMALVQYIPERDAVGLQRGQPRVIRRVWVDSEKLTDD